MGTRDSTPGGSAFMTFVKSLPGILTGAAAVITALAGAYALVVRQAPSEQARGSACFNHYEPNDCRGAR